MDFTYAVPIVIHITSGFTCLITGLIAMTSFKGLNIHKKAGRVFFYSMLVVAISAVWISIFKRNDFLLIIAGFSFILNYFGFRATKNKQLIPSILDWFFLGIGLVNSFFMVKANDVVLIVFGSINLFLLLVTIRIFILTLLKKPIRKLEWLFRHIGLMIGAYIATITAFVVVNVNFVEPRWLVWLLPTFIFVPVIIFFTSKYKNKKSSLSM
jgi:hypothetical protein